MTLDMNSEKGRETLAHELLAVEIIRSIWPTCEYYHTDKTGIAAVDAVMIIAPEVRAVAEMKCRTCSLATLRGKFKNEWLVTYDKLDKGRAAADLLQVEYWGFLYLVPDDIVLRVKLYGPKDGWLVPIRKERTETQATVNGGKANRLNGYVGMATADVLRRKPVL